MSAVEHGRASWLTEECPEWCLREHKEDDHPDDRVHRGRASLIAARLRRSALLHDDDPGVGTQLLVRRMRAVGARETWTQITEPEDTGQMLLLSEETVPLLAEALLGHAVSDSATGPSGSR